LYPFEENTTEENVIKVVSGHDGLSRVSLSEIYLNKFKEKWFIANSKEKKNAFEYALKDEKNYQPLKKLAGKGTCVYVGK
jgi:6-phosphogluconolactonase/glucosamine-6-phosphate isomerase/deaminase